MMQQDEYFPAIRQLAEYEIWCNSKMLDVAAKLSAAQLRESFPFGFKTIHATLFHIVEVFQTWSECVGPTIAEPVLILVGQSDQVTPPEEAQRMRQRIPHARVKIITDAAHYSPIENPSEVNEAIQQFLAGQRG